MQSYTNPTMLVLCTNDTYDLCHHITEEPNVCLLIGNNTSIFRLKDILQSFVVVIQPKDDALDYLLKQNHLPPTIVIQNKTGLTNLIKFNWNWSGQFERRRRGSVVFHQESMRIDV